MAYTIKLTDGKILLNLSDQKTDQLTTSLTLIGKNVAAYGTYYNENFVHLLENFASPVQPRSPLAGQLWYNTALGRMFVYNQNNQFKPVGGPIVSPITPVGVVAGELWLDTKAKQLRVYDGSDFITAGPLYDTTQGKAGWVIEEILATDNITYTVSSLYNNGVLLAILSDKTFTPAVPYKGVAQVNVGLTFNNSISGIRVTATATNATSIANVDSTKFVRNDTNQSINGQLTILSNGGLQVGALNNIQFYVDPATSTATIYSSYPDAYLKLVVTGAIEGTQSAIAIKPKGKKLGIWTDNPTAALDVAGDVNIRGNLFVENNATQVTIQNLAVENTQIELASPVGSLPDGGIEDGGIVLHGTVDHKIVWRNSVPGWEMNSNLNLTQGSGYYISTTLGPVKVLDANATYVSSAPNLNTIGLLTTLNVGNITISTSTISVADGTSDLVLGKLGIGNISVAGKKIVDLRPNSPTDSTTTAVTKYYVDNLQSLRNSVAFVFSCDVTGINDVDGFVINLLNSMLPLVQNQLDTFYIPDNARCRVNTMNYAVPSWTVTGNNNYATETVDKNNVSSAVSVLTAVTVQITSPVTKPVCTQQVREYLAVGRAWVFSNIIS